MALITQFSYFARKCPISQSQSHKLCSTGKVKMADNDLPPIQMIECQASHETSLWARHIVSVIIFGTSFFLV